MLVCEKKTSVLGVRYAFILIARFNVEIIIILVDYRYSECLLATFCYNHSHQTYLLQTVQVHMYKVRKTAQLIVRKVK